MLCLKVIGSVIERLLDWGQGICPVQICPSCATLDMFVKFLSLDFFPLKDDPVITFLPQQGCYRDKVRKHLKILGIHL